MILNISNDGWNILEQRSEKQKVTNYNSGNPSLSTQQSIATPTARNPALLSQISPFVTSTPISQNRNFQTPTARYPTKILNNFEIKLTPNVTPEGPLFLTPHPETCRPHLTTPMETDDVLVDNVMPIDTTTQETKEKSQVVELKAR